MAFAPPAVRANFLYNGDFYVDVGNLNRHKRASIADITEVLRPDLKKLKAGAPNKDPVGHWYEAQLIHYGLPPSKDKVRAKMRLLENLNSSNLKVPPSIASIESELKKEFVTAERKAKAQYKAAMAATNTTSAKPVQSKKRKDVDDQAHALSVNVNINLGTPAIPTQNNQTLAKKRKLQTAPRRGKTAAPSSKISPMTFRQCPSLDNHSGVSPTAASPKPRTKQTARRSQPFLGPRPPVVSHSDLQTPTSSSFSNPYGISGNKLQADPPKQDVKPKKEQKPAAKKEPKVRTEPAIKKEAKVKAAPKVKAEPKVNVEPKVKAEPNTKRNATTLSTIPSAPPPLGLINGVYDISCPTIEQEWPYENPTLILTLDTPQIWGSYDFGMFSGILHIPSRPYSASSSQFLELRWRGRENGEGEMSFGEDCCGGLSFLGDGLIEGWMNLYGKCWFHGVRRDGPGTPVRTARSMREEWEEYNEDEYERERAGRWG